MIGKDLFLFWDRLNDELEMLAIQKHAGVKRWEIFE